MVNFTFTFLLINFVVILTKIKQYTYTKDDVNFKVEKCTSLTHRCAYMVQKSRSNLKIQE